MKTRFIPGLVAMGVATAMVAGCTAGAETSSSPTGAASGSTIEIDVWTHEFEPLQAAMLEKWIPEFEALNEGVRINLTTVPLAGVVTYDAKLLASLSTGTGPDLWDMGDWSFKQMLDNDYLAPMDPSAFGYGSQAELIGHYKEGSTDAMQKDGSLYGAISEFNTMRLFYNKDVFAEAGIPELSEDVPISWDEVGEIGRKLYTEDNGVVTRMGLQFGFYANFRAPQWYAQNFYTLMRQYGQDDLYIDGTAAADTEAVRNAFDLMYQLTFEDKAYDPTFVQNWFADMPQGRTAMVQAGTWYPGAASANADGEFNFGVAPVPVVDPANPETYKDVSWLWGWAVNAASSGPEQQVAQDLLAFILGKKGESEQAAYWFAQMGYLQPTNDFLNSEAYAATIVEKPWLQGFIDALSDYEISAVQHSSDIVGEALIRAIDSVVYDRKTGAEAANALQKELERLP